MPYKVVYFPVRGRAQSLRYIAADQGLELKEETLSSSEWDQYKPKTPFGELPILHDGDFEIAQSNSILRYIARKHGLFGKNEREAALIDMINDRQNDLRQQYLQLIYSNYEDGKSDFVQNIPVTLASLEKILGKNNGGKGFLVGDQINFADYTVFDLLDNFLVLSPSSLDTLPLLKAFHARIAARPKVAKYRSSDDFKKRPINGNGKQ